MSNDEMAYDQAAQALGEHIQGLSDMDNVGLMIMRFNEAMNDGESPKMALAIAKHDLRTIAQYKENIRNGARSL